MHKPRPQTDRNPAPRGNQSPPARRGSAFGLALLGGLLLWAAFPPVNLAPWPVDQPPAGFDLLRAAGASLLAWIAPLPWLLLIAARRLPGRRPYLAIYLAGLVYWLVLLQGVRLAHWATYLGWLALAAYLGAYLPAFVGLARAAVHRFRVPLMLAAPVVWVALELARGYLVTGFSMALLAHTQAAWPLVIQAADLGGGYTVSFAMMFTAACLAQCLMQWRAPPGDAPATLPPPPRRVLGPLLAAGAMVALLLGYGAVRLREVPPAEGPAARVALVQGSIDTQFGDDTLAERTLQHYVDLSLAAAAEGPRWDLMVWPECCFAYPFVVADRDAVPPPEADISLEEFREWLGKMRRNFRVVARNIAAGGVGAPMIVGVETTHYGRDQVRRHNTALLLAADGRPIHRYDKMHPVMFGEYVPLGDLLPWLYRLTPMPSGLEPGTRPQVFYAGRLRMAPHICFENTVPHLIRRQTAELERAGQPPDVLLTLTNDGWFWGSSILDLHLVSGQFRAVELRKPLLIAANTGFSAAIDGNGRLHAKGPRRATGVLVVEVRPDGRTSPYLRWGDLPAALCLAVTAAIALAGLADRMRRRPDTLPGAAAAQGTAAEKDALARE